MGSGVRYEEAAEHIVGKAVRDGVIDARVDHAEGWMESWRRGEGGRGDVYETREPRESRSRSELGSAWIFTMRTPRHPLDTHRKNLAAAAEAREREKKLAKEIESGEPDDDDAEPDL